MAKTICVIGLGNPGAKYQKTWHNLGFLAVDYLAQRYGVSFVDKSKLRAQIAEIVIGGTKLILLKPQTFMNLSGEAVNLVKNYYDLTLGDLLLVFDDYDLPFASHRFREQGSAGTHNGMRSVFAVLGSDQIPRFRIGFQPEHEVADLASFVLSPIPKAAEPVLSQEFEHLYTFLEERMK